MKALVTGGGGFLGTRICQMLRERGEEVVALGRNDYPHLQRQDIPTIRADLRDGDAINQACQGMDVVFHAGAVAGVWGKRETFWDINVGGTRNVIAACRSNGVPRLVFTSSPSAVAGAEDCCNVSESIEYPKRFLAHYPETKAAAEKDVLAANDDHLQTVALRPHLVWGPGDPHLFPRVVSRAKKGRLMQIGDGTNLVDITFVDNAVEAHLLACDALQKGAACAGKPYFISQGEPVRLWSWLADVLRRADLPVPKRRISYKMAKRLGAFSEWSYGLLGIEKEPLLTRFVVAQMATSHYFDISAARSDLGYKARISTSDGIGQLVEYLKQL